jgi:hypothetical protein
MTAYSKQNSNNGMDLINKYSSRGIHRSMLDISVLQNEPDEPLNLATPAVVSRRDVPESHRRVADNFMILKKIFGQPVVHSRISPEEKEILANYDLKPLEKSTFKEIEEELNVLKKWGNFGNPELQKASDKIMFIRAKELKQLIATKFVTIESEELNGHRALERYFDNITKYTN